jgi:hypothetical protein
MTRLQPAMPAERRPAEARPPHGSGAGRTSVARAAAATAYFDAVQGAYDSAASRVGAVERCFRIAGQTLRLRFAGAAMVAAATDALAHLATGDDAADDEAGGLTVCLFDTASTRTEVPAFPWSLRDQEVRGDIASLCTERFLVAYCWWNGVLGLLDRVRRCAVFWIRDAAEFPFNERGSPLLMHLYGWLQPHGLQLLHAGAVGTAEGGVLLAGRGGAGKSTTAMAAMLGGLSYAGDDYCAVAMEPEPVVHGVYSSGKLARTGLHRFPQLAAAAPHGSDGEKALFFVGAVHPERVARRLVIRAVLLPQIHDGSECTIEPLSRALAVRELVSSTIGQIPGADAAVLTAAAAFIRRLPCYRLRIGADVERIPARIAEVVRRPP